jgi:hypothetical protein
MVLDTNFGFTFLPLNVLQIFCPFSATSQRGEETGFDGQLLRRVYKNWLKILE